MRNVKRGWKDPLKPTQDPLKPGQWRHGSRRQTGTHTHTHTHTHTDTDTDTERRYEGLNAFDK